MASSVGPWGSIRLEGDGETAPVQVAQPRHQWCCGLFREPFKRVAHEGKVEPPKAAELRKRPLGAQTEGPGRSVRGAGEPLAPFTDAEKGAGPDRLQKFVPEFRIIVLGRTH